MKNEEMLKIINDLKSGRYKSISKEKISETDLLNIAEKLKEDHFDLNILINIILLNNINQSVDKVQCSFLFLKKCV